MKTHKLSALTIERLTDIKFNILAVPETFRMESEFQNEDASPCGTAGCIAGHACALLHHVKKLSAAQDKTDYFGPLSAMSQAADFLDLCFPQQQRLFFLSQHTNGPRWPRRFEDAYLDATTAKARAKVAAERIDHFIATDGEK